MSALELLNKYDAKVGEMITLLEASIERERVNLQTIRELTVALRVQEGDLREANARIRAYERATREGAEG